MKSLKTRITKIENYESMKNNEELQPWALKSAEGSAEIGFIEPDDIESEAWEIQRKYLNEKAYCEAMAGRHEEFLMSLSD